MHRHLPLPRTPTPTLHIPTHCPRYTPYHTPYHIPHPSPSTFYTLQGLQLHLLFCVVAGHFSIGSHVWLYVSLLFLLYQFLFVWICWFFWFTLQLDFTYSVVTFVDCTPSLLPRLLLVCGTLPDYDSIDLLCRRCVYVTLGERLVTVARLTPVVVVPFER